VGEAARQLLPHRPAIAALAGALTAAVPGDRRRLGPAARAVLDVLTGDPLAAPLRLRLATAALGARPLAALLADLDAAGWRPDVLMTAAQLLQSDVNLPPRERRQIENALAGSPSSPLRRLALAALLGQGRHWDAPRQARLERYRQDADPLVASAAQFFFPPDEEGEDEDPIEDEVDW
jgi:hypothetical protein